MRPFIVPALLTSLYLCPILAEDADHPAPAPAPTPSNLSDHQNLPSSAAPVGYHQSPPGSAAPLDPAKRQALFKERQALYQQLAPLRQQAMKDPELQHLRDDLMKAQKEFQEKVEAAMASQPGYTDVKAKLDAINQQLGIRTSGMGMGGGGMGMPPAGPHLGGFQPGQSGPVEGAAPHQPPTAPMPQLPQGSGPQHP